MMGCLAGSGVSNAHYCNNLQTGLIANGKQAYTGARQANKKRMRAVLESLLHARKLDVTLTTAAAPRLSPDRLAPAGSDGVHAAPGGGPRPRAPFGSTRASRGS